jgi:hypothetical protein
MTCEGKWWKHHRADGFSDVLQRLGVGATNGRTRLSRTGSRKLVPEKSVHRILSSKTPGEQSPTREALVGLAALKC